MAEMIRDMETEGLISFGLQKSIVDARRLSWSEDMRIVNPRKQMALAEFVKS